MCVEMEKESRVAPGFNCRNLGVPLRPLRYQAVVHCLHLASSMQPSLEVSQATTFLMLQEGKNNKYQSIIPPGLHTFPLLEAQLLVVAPYSMQL